MQFSADCSFHIGAQHLRSGMPCQDYAVCGILPADAGIAEDERAFAVVSDGCSSGGRTDVGARLTALSWANSLRLGFESDSATPEKIGERLGLWTPDLLATRLTAVALREEVFVCVCGDGAVATRYNDGMLRMWRMEWANNMPCYPAYAADNFRGFIEAQRDQEGSAFQIERWVNDGSSFCQEAYLTKGLDCAFLLRGHQINIHGGVSAVAVFSDGVTQVEGMPWQNVVADLMAFKSTAGDFVKRRMNRFLKDHRPVDDISMACIMVEP